MNISDTAELPRDNNQTWSRNNWNKGQEGGMWSWNFDTVNKAVINISCCGDER